MADFGDYARNYLTMADAEPKNTFATANALQNMNVQRRQDANLQRQMTADEETRRRNAALESARMRQQANSEKLSAYNAALKAYELGIGPNPGPLGGGGAMGAQPQQQPMTVHQDLMQLPPGERNKIMAKRIADKPEVETKMEGLFTTFDQMIDEANKLAAHPSMVTGSGMTGIVMRNTPDITDAGARNFGERMKSLGAQIGFNALSNMREMSKTGGALGQVSDFENKRLEAAISALDTQQTPDDIRRALQQVVNYSRAAKKNMKNAYERTYGTKPPEFEKKDIVPPNTGGPKQADQELIFNGYKFPNKEKLDAYRKAIGG